MRRDVSVFKPRASPKSVLKLSLTLLYLLLLTLGVPYSLNQDVIKTRCPRSCPWPRPQPITAPISAHIII